MSYPEGGENQVYDENDGVYNCTFTAADISGGDWSTGWYNVTINATKEYYNDSQTYVLNKSFRLVTRPELSNENAESGNLLNKDGWGQDWTFSVDVADADGDNVTVYLWINLTGNFWGLKRMMVVPPQPVLRLKL